MPRFAMFIAISGLSPVLALEVAGYHKKIEPKLDPVSDKTFFGPPFPADYPSDDKPVVSTGLHFKHPYPDVLSSDKYEADYVKDENNDGGEWKAQMEYDTLRVKLQGVIRETVKTKNVLEEKEGVLDSSSSSLREVPKPLLREASVMGQAASGTDDGEPPQLPVGFVNASTALSAKPVVDGMRLHQRPAWSRHDADVVVAADEAMMFLLPSTAHVPSSTARKTPVRPASAPWPASPAHFPAPRFLCGDPEVDGGWVDASPQFVAARAGGRSPSLSWGFDAECYVGPQSDTSASSSPCSANFLGVCAAPEFGVPSELQRECMYDGRAERLACEPIQLRSMHLGCSREKVVSVSPDLCVEGAATVPPALRTKDSYSGLCHPMEWDGPRERQSSLKRAMSSSGGAHSRLKARQRNDSCWGGKRDQSCTFDQLCDERADYDEIVVGGAAKPPPGFV